jgi:hypothetical protein
MYFPNIIIQKINTFSLPRFNTCNYSKDEVKDEVNSMSEEEFKIFYEKTLRKTGLDQYVRYLKDEQWIEVHLSPITISILKKYNNSSWKCNRLVIPELSEEDNFNELWSCVGELKKTGLFNGTRWFFRFARNSPKDGLPSFPVLSEYDVLKKIVTSSRAKNALQQNNYTLYFKKFDDLMSIEHEFRVFIYNKRITAISSYSVDFTIYNLLNENELKILVGKIFLFWKSLTFLDILPLSYTMDIYIDQNNDCIRLIEFNSFGYYMAAGSCLFDWIDDYSILYSNGDQIVLRLANQ